MGNILTLKRKKDNTLIDDLTFGYKNNNKSNQLEYISDAAGSQNSYDIKEYQNKSDDNAEEFTYDVNGNMTLDADREICSIEYNVLNLPEKITFTNGNLIKNLYDAGGRKLASSYLTKEPIVVSPISGTNGTRQLLYTGTTTNYIDNVEYESEENVYSDISVQPEYILNRVYNDEGYTQYVDDPIYYYYRKDHLDNNREVWQAAHSVRISNQKVEMPATTVQRTQYYPSGLPWAESLGADVQNKKYNDKEFVEMHGWDTYDYGARGMYAAIGRWMNVDPLAELYYSISPYAYCAGNPVKYVDNIGMWPTKNAVDKGKVGNRGFSLTPVMNPYHKVMRPHKGQDFPVPEGNNVRSLAAGVVSNISYNEGGWGYYIDIKHIDGYTTRYAHLQKGGIKVKIGDKIADGEIIALSGMTGGATGPHLHLEVLLNGKPQNPMLIEDLQELLYGSNEIINNDNPIELPELIVVAKNPNPQKTLEQQLRDMEWSSVRSDQNGNTGRYNMPNRSCDKFYSDDFLKWYYDGDPKNDSNTK